MKIFKSKLPLFLSIFLLFGVSMLYSQNGKIDTVAVSAIPGNTDTSGFIYPKGAYLTYEDFASIKPTMDIDFKKTQLKNITSTNFQLFYDDYKRVKKPFAVSNGKELFIRVKHFKKQVQSKYKGQPSDANRDYMLAYLVNKDFLYFENEFLSDYGIVVKFVRYGILYDCSLKKFIVLDRNVKLNYLVNKNFPQFNTEFVFDGKRPDLEKVRKLMTKIFTVK